MQADGNHTDSAVGSQTVTISQQSVKPSIELSPPSAAYNGSEHRPTTVTVRDSTDHLIPASEYTVVYGTDTNWIDTGSHKVTVKNVSGGNFDITEASVDFQITEAKPSPLEIVNKPGQVYFGDAPFSLSVSGGSGNGAITWYSDNTDVATIDPNGLVTIHAAGTVMITAKKAASENYGESTAVYSFTVNPKQDTVTVTLTLPDGGYIYNSTAKTPDVTVTASDGTVLSLNTDYTVNYDNNVNAGTAAEVTVTRKGGNYEFGPVSATFEIAKADTSINSNPTASPTTSGQPLKEIPLTGGSANVSGSFAWTDGDTIFTEGGTYSVTFTPDDSNYKTATIEITVTVTASNPSEGGDTGGGDTPSYTAASAPAIFTPSVSSAPSAVAAPAAPMQTSVQDNTATTILNTAAGDNLVKEAVASQSTNIIIKPEITGNVTKTEVSLPASTASKLSSETNAALTVSTPVANVTIPNAALGTLSNAGGTINVMTEQIDNTVTLTLTAGGEEVENVPGGLTLTVPVEDAGPGTVAVLVHEDGTRETIRKSVAENGEMSIPLNGSATVEIVDNSKAFADVPAETWMADAVAFASAHELFSGTGETTFSPEQPMSRGMLATVLYNLEGRPAQSLTGKFSDVSSDAWYAEGVSWAAANGITNGYGNGQFGPDDNVTREQFVVMLWKYAGSPAANGQTLSFTDADQASGYAEEALCWATANGILNGYDNGQLDPGGLTTRAQAAQMLKNFMENI